MAAARDIRDHHVRCEPHLARLQMMACYERDEPLPPGLPDEVVEATSAILAEAQAAGRVMMAALANSQRRAVTAFLDARLERLAAAAGEMAAAAVDGDVAILRRHLRKFEVLTSALWTVQLELSANAVPPPPGGRSSGMSEPAPVSGGRRVDELVLHGDHAIRAPHHVDKVMADVGGLRPALQGHDAVVHRHHELALPEILDLGTFDPACPGDPWPAWVP